MNIYIEDLRRLVAKYNLHLNIRRYSKMRKSDLLDQITSRGWVCLLYTSDAADE